MAARYPWLQSKVLEKLLMVTFVPAVFLFKKHKVGRCRFVIDTSGISRTCKAGEITIPWAEVQAIHTLSQAYMVELDKGAMPLPFRCFESQCRSRFAEVVPKNLIATEPR